MDDAAERLTHSSPGPSSMAGRGPPIPPQKGAQSRRYGSGALPRRGAASNSSSPQGGWGLHFILPSLVPDMTLAVDGRPGSPEILTPIEAGGRGGPSRTGSEAPPVSVLSPGVAAPRGVPVTL